MRNLVALLLSFIASLSSCFAADSVFTIINWPDIHARLDNEGTSDTNMITVKTWALAHTNDGVWNVKGFILDGDIVGQEGTDCGNGYDCNTNKLSQSELTNAFNDLRAAGLFVWVKDGNHDGDNFNTGLDDNSTGLGFQLVDATTNAFSNCWPVSFFIAQTNIPGVGYVTNLDGAASAKSQRIVMCYTNGEIKLLHVPLSCSMYTVTNGVLADLEIQTLPQILQASNIALQFPDHNVLSGAHSLLSWSQQMMPFSHFADDFSIQDYWLTHLGIYKHMAHSTAAFPMAGIPNLLLMTSGHNRGLWSGHVMLKGFDGHEIDVQCFNMQFAGPGAGQAGVWNGKYIKLIRFNWPLRRVEIRCWDVQLDQEFPGPFVRTLGGTNYNFPCSWNIPLIRPTGIKRILKQ